MPRRRSRRLCRRKNAPFCGTVTTRQYTVPGAGGRECGRTERDVDPITTAFATESCDHARIPATSRRTPSQTRGQNHDIYSVINIIRRNAILGYLGRHRTVTKKTLHHFLGRSHARTLASRSLFGEGSHHNKRWKYDSLSWLRQPTVEVDNIDLGRLKLCQNTRSARQPYKHDGYSRGVACCLSAARLQFPRIFITERRQLPKNPQKN